jgi:hypothetical protein
MANTERKGSEFDPLPGKLTNEDRAALTVHRSTRAAGQPVPSVAAPYNGWDTRSK